MRGCHAEVSCCSSAVAWTACAVKNSATVRPRCFTALLFLRCGYYSFYEARCIREKMKDITVLIPNVAMARTVRWFSDVMLGEITCRDFHAVIV